MAFRKVYTEKVLNKLPSLATLFVPGEWLEQSDESIDGNALP